ncbi:UNVERIFIED_CONTAM: hypothetical protein GTU68_054007 [Idotea baltica]|nr:hypothetical protein [Idotea baltica]
MYLTSLLLDWMKSKFSC